jgi:NAD(P)-dependent dehydrogenase (short-subunit alcohol dehydrogenase family)
MEVAMAESDLSKQFAGNYAVVTGGTQGLGEAIARLFAERGAAGLVICGRNRERGEAVAAEIAAGGCAAHYVRADLERVEDCRTVIARADAAFGTLHALVNVAAVTDRGTILDTSPELFDRMFALNVRAPFFLMQDAAKIMRRERTEGAIVNILSMSSHGGQPFIAAYCASKGALATLTRNTGYALMRDRIRVNGLNIGWMDTPAEHTIQTDYHGRPDNWLAEAERVQPFGRLLKTREVARAVAFLCSAESGLMTGSLVDFDQSILGAYEAPPQPATALADTG